MIVDNDDKTSINWLSLSLGLGLGLSISIIGLRLGLIQNDNKNQYVYSKNDIQNVMKLNPIMVNELLNEIGNFFQAFSYQNFKLADITHLEFENQKGDACIKSGYLKNGNYFIIKVASGGFGYGSSGMMNLFSQKTGKLEGILLDEGKYFFFHF